MPDATNSAATEMTVIPLYVDLDGTMVKADLFAEGALRLLKRNPALGLAMVYRLVTRGKAALKEWVARQVEPDLEGLPLQQDFVAFLRSEAAAARPIFLASAANVRNAQALADHIGCFSGVLASDDETNLAGARKLDAILSHCKGNPFDYAGNSWPDVAIWRRARQGIFVNPAPGIVQKVRATGKVMRVFEDRQRGIAVVLGAVRIHQWLKNLLLFVPLLTAQQWLDATAVRAVLIAYVAFGLCASGTYLYNDLMDLPADRRHPRKRLRPLAAGDLAVSTAMLLIIALLAAGFALALLLPVMFNWILLTYVFVTLAYSMRIKNYVVLDVVCLAGLYTLRILAGAAAIGVAVSSWLLGYSMFLFMSLALVKRCSDLVHLRRDNAPLKLSGRDYHVADYHMLASMGIASGYVSVLVLALFVDSSSVVVRYAQPEILWLLCPAMLYWVSRLWIKTSRGEIHDDPIIFSMKDRAGWVVFIAIVCIWISAQRAW